MKDPDFDVLVRELQDEIAKGEFTVGVLGSSSVAVRLLAMMRAIGEDGRILGIYTNDNALESLGGVPLKPFAQLVEDSPQLLVVTSDEDKERLLWSALPFVRSDTKVIISGYGHFEFRDPLFDSIKSNPLVPSLANGYPNSLIHLYQCLKNAARLGLAGCVVELGMFKGGTTMFLSRTIEQLGQTWPVIGFDSFSGFPPRRSALDMYAHPDCVFDDVEAVRSLTSGRNIEIVVGDVVESCQRLTNENIVLSFVDTDNYSSALSATRILKERTVVGGAIVFDHFAGTNRFKYTLGERMAASTLLEDARYFNLHGTGVFLRQR